MKRILDFLRWVLTAGAALGAATAAAGIALGLAPLAGGGFAVAVFSILGLLLLAMVARGRSPRVAPPLRRLVLEVLAAASRQGEPAGAALAAVAEEVKGRGRAAVLRALGRLDAGEPLSAALSPAAAPAPFLAAAFLPREDAFLDREEAAALAAVEGKGGVADLLGGGGLRAPEAPLLRVAVLLPLGYALVMLGIGAFLTVFILPQFGRIFSQLEGVELPPEIRFLLATGLFDRLFKGLLLAASLGILLAWARRSPDIRDLQQAVLLRVPVLGGILRLDAAGRVLRVLGILVTRGLPLHEALSRAAPAAGLERLVHSLEEAAAAVAHGVPVRAALGGSGLPAFAAARAAAASGGDPASLGRALEALSGECTRRARARRVVLGSLVYPAVLVLVAAFALLTYLGIFGAMGAVVEAYRPW